MWWIGSIFFILLIIAFFYYLKQQIIEIQIFIYIKYVLGFIFIFLYTNYFNGDLDFYLGLFQQWKNLSFWELMKAKDLILIDTNLNVFTLIYARYLTLLWQFSGKNLWVMVFLFNSVANLIYLFVLLEIKKYRSEEFRPVLYAFAFPSILFWSSGLTKETVALPVFVFSIFNLYQLIIEQRKLHWVTWLIWIFLLFTMSYLRYFYTGILGLLLLALISYRYYKNPLIYMLMVIPIYFLFFKNDWLLPHLRPEILIELIYYNYHKLSQSPNAIILPFEKASWLEFLPLLSWTWIHNFFLNFDSLFSVLASLENLILLFLCSIMLVNKIKYKIFYIQELFFAFLCIPFLSALVVISPNLGSLIRYRIFLWYFILFWYFKFVIIDKKIRNKPTI